MLRDSLNLIHKEYQSLSARVNNQIDFYNNVILALRDKGWPLAIKNNRLFVIFSQLNRNAEAELISLEEKCLIDIPSNYKKCARLYLNGRPLLYLDEDGNSLSHSLSLAKESLVNRVLFSRVPIIIIFS